MRLSLDDANHLFDLLEDSIAPHPELSTRETFTEVFTTAIPEGQMILDDGHRVFIVSPVVEKDGAMRFTVAANALTVQNNVLGDKLFNAHKALDDLYFNPLP